MALRVRIISNRRKFGLVCASLILGLFSLPSARATQSRTYEIQTGDCRILKLENKQWIPLQPGSIPAKERVIGDVFSQGKGWILFRREGGIDPHIGSDRCVVEKPLETQSSETDPLTPFPAPVASEPSVVTPPSVRVPMSWFLKTSILVYRDPVDIVTATGTRYPYAATNSGICPGVGVSFHLGSAFRSNTALCPIFLRSNLVPVLETSTSATTTNTSNTLNYSDRGAWVYGLLLEPDLLWKVADHAGAFGFAFSFMYRKGSWTAPPASGTIESASKLRVGFFLKSELQKGHWVVSPQVGFYSKLENAAAQLELRFHFGDQY